MGFEPDHLISAYELKLRALIVRRWRRFRNWNDGKYAYTALCRQIINELLKLEFRFYIYSLSTMKYKTIIKLKHWYFLAGIELKKINSCLKYQCLSLIIVLYFIEIKLQIYNRYSSLYSSFMIFLRVKHRYITCPCISWCFG